MKAEEAAKFTMHSCRHVYPTCAFQLLFPPPAVTLMGHWAAKADKISSGYDGARTATELAYKAVVAMNVRGGWRPVPHGSIPNKALYPFAGDMGCAPPPASHDSPGVLAARPKKKPKKANMAGEASVSTAAGPGSEASMPRYIFPFGVVQVLNERTKTVHLSPGEGTACNAWRCGSKSNPAAYSEFAGGTQRWTPTRNPFRFCLACYSAKGLRRLGATLRVADEDLQGSDSSTSEAESDSES